jgi:hypothetical protein
LLDLVPAEDREPTRNALFSQIDRDSDIIHECRMLNKDSKIRHCQWAQSGALGDLSAHKQALENIIFNCDSLINLISDILDLEKLDAGKMTLAPESKAGQYSCGDKPD